MREIFKYKDYIIYSVRAKLINETIRNHLGFFWWFIEPVLQMSVYYFVFIYLFKRRTEEFTLFLLIGITTWQWFANSVQLGAGSIKQASAKMKQVYFPKAILPTVAITTRTVKFLIIFLLIMLWVGIKIGVSATWISIPIIMLTQIIITYSGTLFSAAVIPFIPDLSFLVNSILSAGFFCSGVFFEIKPDSEMYDVFMLNPMAKLLEQYRVVLLQNQWPEWYSLLKLSLFGTLFVFVLLIAINKLDKHFPRIA